MEKKYEFTDEIIEIDGHVLHRIRAVRDFTLNDGTEIKKGDLGGFIEKEDNLSHEGDCWVSWNAGVYGDAQVYGDALVCDNAWVSGNAQVYGNARVVGNARVCGNARVGGNALVRDSAQVSGNAQVYGDAQVYGHALVCDNAQVCGNAQVHGYAHVCDSAWVSGNARVCDSAQVSGNAWVYGDALVCRKAYIRSNDDYCVIQGFGSKNRSTTFYNTSSEDGKYEVSVKCGCFNGTLEEFESEVKETHGDSKYGREYLALLQAMKIHFGIE